MTGTPWSVRHARSAGEQPALEIYEDGDLIGVMVAHTMAPQLLRGARRACRGGQTFCLAWGRLPGDGSAMTVTFNTGWRRGFSTSWRRGMTQRQQDAGAIQPDLTDLAGWCWLAVAAGQFDAVMVATRATSHRLRFRAGASL